jgi:K+-sensing histidine kinase KdpD
MTSKVFPDSKVHQFVSHIKSVPMKDIESEIAKWIEQNNPEQIVVGLSRNDVDSLWNYMLQHSNIDRYMKESEVKDLMFKWLASQTFTIKEHMVEKWDVPAPGQVWKFSEFNTEHEIVTVGKMFSKQLVYNSVTYTTNDYDATIPLDEFLKSFERVS